MDPEASRFAEEPSSEERELLELCAVAEARTRRQGHDLVAWRVPADEDGRGRRAACKRCGRVAYVRIEDGLAGMAGAALNERCHG